MSSLGSISHNRKLNCSVHWLGCSYANIFFFLSSLGKSLPFLHSIDKWVGIFPMSHPRLERDQVMCLPASKVCSFQNDSAMQCINSVSH